MPERIGYDVLLESRVNQLKEIERSLCYIQERQARMTAPFMLTQGLIIDVLRMIQQAEAESAAF